MKSQSYMATVAAILTAASALSARADVNHPPFFFETEREYFANGDFDGDGKLDLAIVDKERGRIRIGARMGENVYLWDKYLNSGVKDVTGVAMGHLFDAETRLRSSK
jgi:hypothetical protein